MKIAFFYYLDEGGALKVANDQIKYLAKNHTINLYKIIDVNEDKNMKNLNNFLNNTFTYTFKYYKISILPKRILRDLSVFIKLNKIQKKIASQIDEGKYDLVIVHPDKHTQSPFILKYLKTKNIYYAHEWLRVIYEKQFIFKENVSMIKKIYEKLIRIIIKNIDMQNINSADKIITNSIFTSKNLVKAYKLKSETCYPGVNTKKFINKKFYKRSDIIFIGDKNESEGYNLLKTIVNQLNQKYKIDIISRKRNNYSISEAELINKLNQSKICLCLSRMEPFGLIPLESMSCGCPVIAINEGGYKESIINNKTGFLVNPGVKNIIEKIIFLLENEKIRSKFSRNCINVMRKTWSTQKRMLEFEKKIVDYVKN